MDREPAGHWFLEGTTIRLLLIVFPLSASAVFSSQQFQLRMESVSRMAAAELTGHWSLNPVHSGRPNLCWTRLADLMCSESSDSCCAISLKVRELAMRKRGTKLQWPLVDPVIKQLQIYNYIHSFIHSGYLYSAPSRNLLRGALSPATVKEKCLN